MEDKKIKTSKKMQEFGTGAHRDTQENKPRFELIPTIALRRLALHYAKGADLYGEDNWKQGIPLKRLLGSALRHIMQSLDGMEDEDHEAAALWNICGFMYTKDAIKRGILPKSLDNLPCSEDSFIKIPLPIKKEWIDENAKESMDDWIVKHAKRGKDVVSEHQQGSKQLEFNEIVEKMNSEPNMDLVPDSFAKKIHKLLIEDNNKAKLPDLPCEDLEDIYEELKSDTDSEPIVPADLQKLGSCLNTSLSVEKLKDDDELNAYEKVLMKKR
jgi:hypothetical protein